MFALKTRASHLYPAAARITSDTDPRSGPREVSDYTCDCATPCCSARPGDVRREPRSGRLRRGHWQPGVAGRPAGGLERSPSRRRRTALGNRPRGSSRWTVSGPGRHSPASSGPVALLRRSIAKTRSHARTRSVAGLRLDCDLRQGDDEVVCQSRLSSRYRCSADGVPTCTPTSVRGVRDSAPKCSRPPGLLTVLLTLEARIPAKDLHRAIFVVSQAR